MIKSIEMYRDIYEKVVKSSEKELDMVDGLLMNAVLRGDSRILLDELSEASINILSSKGFFVYINKEGYVMVSLYKIEEIVG